MKHPNPLAGEIWRTARGVAVLVLAAGSMAQPRGARVMRWRRGDVERSGTVRSFLRRHRPAVAKPVGLPLPKRDEAWQTAAGTTAVVVDLGDQRARLRQRRVSFLVTATVPRSPYTVGAVRSVRVSDFIALWSPVRRAA